MKGKNPMGDLGSILGGDPMRYIGLFMQNGDPEMFKTIIEKVDMLKHGAECMQMACVSGKDKIVDLLVERGVDITNPPQLVASDDAYRRSPFIIQAAKSGSPDTYTTVKRHIIRSGGTPMETGCICLSKKKKNVVISNAIGCAAFWGKHQLLKQLLSEFPQDCRELEALEHQDKDSKTKGTSAYMREYSKYTPLMLAIAGGDHNLECVKALLNKGVDYKCEDDQGNTVLHIAAMNGCNQILEFLCKNLKIELFARNKVGETTLSICQQ
jgi:hypothetical protein